MVAVDLTTVTTACSLTVSSSTVVRKIEAADCSSFAVYKLMEVG